MTDITVGCAGNAERMAFLFDTRRLKPSGLACELVVPPEWLGEVGPDALRQQFARTPYAVGFNIGASTFILVTLQVTYGEASADRLPDSGALRAGCPIGRARKTSGPTTSLPSVAST